MSDLTKDLKQLQLYYFKKPINEDAIELLDGGYSFANNYRIEHAGKTYLARFMSAEQSLASREKECLITDHVGKIGVGAKVYYQNPEKGILLTEFVQGRNANYDDMVNLPNRDLIVTNIKKLHQSTQLDFPKAKTVTDHIQDTFKRVDSALLQQQLKSLDLMAPLNSLFQAEKNNLTAVLIHGDLNPDNILISTNRVYIIDWTDAGIGDPLSDISWHAICFPLSLHKNVLRYYFDHVDTFMQQKLLCYYCLRLFLLSAWGVFQANRLSKGSEFALNDIIKQQHFPEPSELAAELLGKKIRYKTPNDFLLVSATMFHFLSHFTKTDQFISAIEGLSHHA